MRNDLIFAGKLPVVINRNGDTRDIYNPIRSCSCDITVVSNKILSDLYTNDKKGIKVKVEKIGKTNIPNFWQLPVVLFEGYMTPNSYSQKLSPNLDNIDMTAIDPLAVLKYLYVDDILEKAKSITMGELIARALAAVKIDCVDLWIENTVSYTDAENVNYNFVDLVVQTSNFWDEGDDPSSVYDVVCECLRLFGYTLTFTGDKYIIYTVISNHEFGSENRDFILYKIEDGGTLRAVGTGKWNKESSHFKHSAGEWTTIDGNPTVSIDNTYDKVVSVASTKIPNYSLTAFDLVSAENRDMYDAGDLNVQRNKIKGFKESDTYDDEYTNDEWYYLWNGVYINDDYELDIKPDRIVNGYININGAYEYMTGQTGHPSAYGGILNFYGGEANPVGTTKDPQEERAVEVKECITVFAPDNGLAPEFLEKEYLKWEYKVGQGNDGEEYTTGDLSKVVSGIDTSKFGTNKTGVADAVSYRQRYENITISENAEQTLVIDMSQSYSRTGINQTFDTLDYSTVENKRFTLTRPLDGDTYFGQQLISGTAYTYPWTWKNDSVSVSMGYFDKYKYSNTDSKLKPVWDKRKVILSITTLDGKKYQFNGKDWVETEDTTDANAFYLKKLMNYKKIFIDEFTYDLIECSDGTTYALNPDSFKYYSTNRSNPESNGVYPEGEGEKETNEVEFEYYAKATQPWKKYIDEADEGRIAIILPAINSVNATVQCDIYHSNLLGITGITGNYNSSNTAHYVKYKVEGEYSFETDSGMLSESLIGDEYGKVGAEQVNIDFMPVNATYIKAEHLNLDISLSVPESNLGQMFGESDIKYSTNHSKRFRESYDAPSFLVNTKHPVVMQSHSYVIVGNALADANRFSIGWSYNKIPCRPENYVMQGYKNYWGVIRRTYNRVLVPHKTGFSNCLCFIEAPDIPDVGNGRWLMVVSDSWDVKTNRHTISAVEDYDLNVNKIENYTVLEIPREARNPRFNLPSVKK